MSSEFSFQAMFICWHSQRTVSHGIGIHCVGLDLGWFVQFRRTVWAKESHCRHSNPIVLRSSDCKCLQRESVLFFCIFSRLQDEWRLLLL